MDASTPTNAEKLKESASKLMSDWLAIAKGAAEEAEKFVKEKPVAGAAIAFVAGWILGSKLGSK